MSRCRSVPGARIGIVGGSGSGKSTLGRLLVALAAPQKGEIRLDGVALDKIDNTALRMTVGYVDQTTTLISGSIRENLTMWDSRSREERIVAAARDARCTKSSPADPAPMTDG